MASALKGFGLPGEIRRIEIDPRVGGKFCFSDQRGGMEAVHRGPTWNWPVRPELCLPGSLGKVLLRKKLMILQKSR